MLRTTPHPRDYALCGRPRLRLIKIRNDLSKAPLSLIPLSRIVRAVGDECVVRVNSTP